MGRGFPTSLLSLYDIFYINKLIIGRLFNPLLYIRPNYPKILFQTINLNFQTINLNFQTINLNFQTINLNFQTLSQRWHQNDHRIEDVAIII